MRGAKNFKLFWHVSFVQHYLLNSERLLQVKRSAPRFYTKTPGAANPRFRQSGNHRDGNLTDSTGSVSRLVAATQPTMSQV